MWFFAKRKTLGCNCGKRTKGNPKHGYGVCYGGGYGYREAVITRIEGKRLCHKWLRVGVREESEL